MGGLASLRVSSPRHRHHHHSNLRVESDIWIPLAPILFGSITSAQLHWGCGDTFTVIPSA
ncbi:TonB box, conserved site [Penicillium camemberti]|uniref:TonB box, conserved site n=1 Tax=Penicillium camemberti (strain FM 013) TaxID=1429867 RepID=A0A0G4PTD4_PENC3|nr:TonB box, conserved site [Penicillium camemberti]